MKNENIFFLSHSSEKQVDILLVTGDAYIDHPSFGIAIISRVLENAGYSVCIVSQPDYKNRAFLDSLPDVRLFIGVSAGNLDSVVSNYTSNRNRRKEDDYSIDGCMIFPEGHLKRPDRASITYVSYLKQRYKHIPIVLGGIEASLRRFAHYDFVQDKIRQSILLDTKADCLVYGMGEKAVVDIAKRLDGKNDLFGIPGTAIAFDSNKLSVITNNQPYTALPSYEEILSEPYNLIKATMIIEENMTGLSSENLIQFSGNKAVLTFSPQKTVTQNEIDEIYNLPYRRDFPAYCESIPAYRMIKDSITSHRGCYGRCSFCAIASHQGPFISSRSESSIIQEALSISEKSSFKGTISDIGGPTANMYGSYCSIGGCKKANCLYPGICKNLVIRQDIFAEVIQKVKNTKGIKHIFINSGLRYDIMLTDEISSEYIIVNHTSGLLKVAPEHTNNAILQLMRKPSFTVFERFIQLFNRIKKKNNLNYYILPYIILSHPGSDNNSAEELGKTLIKHSIATKQYQDFTPTPGTVSTAMYYAGKNVDNQPIHIPKHSSLNNPQRNIVERLLKSNHGKNR
ncbi:MAG: YgiQ family radical SAM protein [Spirochaetes bacterium GWF1_31_7]|nr:MAG: YgiQ family radical SAM protein [Spirochaetes bacterium GWE1_32_154]OHD48023.1 MAG: YgiQ family radical SAM protein [Spirochaetes bacterium GWF1_31_7]OHD49660.1 MAG: YgiQ family radical SAM protein [Spirochaetes bacterium GWE2_31_10]HBD92764.1 YgiQ family radical SAM protein [Spirochaetia bacterium]HBI36449.1 YgiQ family radical SAM protein [Spirochaetia bacterium]